MNKTVALAFALMILIVLGTTNNLPAKAQSSEAITIKADGTIDPPLAPLKQTGNTYTLTDNITGSITIQKDATLFDGKGYTIQTDYADFSITLTDVNNVTIQNVVVRSVYGGVFILDTSNTTITNNTVVCGNNGFGIAFRGNCSGNLVSENNLTGIDLSYSPYSKENIVVGNRIVSNYIGIIALVEPNGGAAASNTIVGNQIENNSVGIEFGLINYDYYNSFPNPFYMNNLIYCNNFVNNTKNFVNEQTVFYPHECINIWDNGTAGNYWSNYNGTDANHDGTGDTPYLIDGNNTDNYPLMAPVNISEVLPNLLQSLTHPVAYTYAHNNTFPKTVPNVIAIAKSFPNIITISQPVPNIYTSPNHNTNLHICTFTVNNPTDNTFQFSHYSSREQFKFSNKHLLDWRSGRNSNSGNRGRSAGFQTKEESSLTTKQDSPLAAVFGICKNSHRQFLQMLLHLSQQLYYPKKEKCEKEKRPLFNPLTLVYMIVPLVVGVLSGYLLRNRKLPKLDKVALAVIVILIFSLGFGIGSNNQLLSSLPQVGFQALIIAAMAILFSIAFVKLGKKLGNTP